MPGESVVEEVGYIAIEGDLASLSAQSGFVDISHVKKSVSFSGFSEPPVFLGDVQTSNGADPGHVRTKTVTPTSTVLWFEEETSADLEVTHAVETFAYLALGDGPLYATIEEQAPEPTDQSEEVPSEETVDPSETEEEPVQPDVPDATTFVQTVAGVDVYTVHFDWYAIYWKKMF